MNVLCGRCGAPHTLAECPTKPHVFTGVLNARADAFIEARDMRRAGLASRLSECGESIAIQRGTGAVIGVKHDPIKFQKPKSAMKPWQPSTVEQALQFGFWRAQDRF